MIEPASEWVAALFESDLFRRPEEDHKCVDCRRPIMFGRANVERCADCANERERASRAASKRRRRVRAA